jgi:hypothetical protein
MNKSMPAQSDRSQRRLVRSLAGLLAIALAFVACNLLASFVPSLATSFDTGTEKIRSGLLAAGSPAAVGGIAAGVFALLVVTMVFLAGLEGKAGFMVPAVVLVLVAGVLGIQPMGHRLTLERTNAGFEEQMRSLKGEISQWKSKCGSAEDLCKTREVSLAEMQKKLDDQEKAAGAAAETASKEIASRDERVRSLMSERDKLAVTVLDQKAAITDKDKRIGAMETENARLKKDADALKKENEALKKQIEELKKRPQ